MSVTGVPWIAKRGSYINDHWIQTPLYTMSGLLEDDAEFIAKAHTAYSIMQHRKLGVIYNELDSKWHVAPGDYDATKLVGEWWPDSFSAWCVQHGFDCPHEALIQADIWYRENVEG